MEKSLAMPMKTLNKVVNMDIDAFKLASDDDIRSIAEDILSIKYDKDGMGKYIRDRINIPIKVFNELPNSGLYPSDYFDMSNQMSMLTDFDVDKMIDIGSCAFTSKVLDGLDKEMYPDNSAYPDDEDIYSALNNVLHAYDSLFLLPIIVKGKMYLLVSIGTRRSNEITIPLCL